MGKDLKGKEIGMGLSQRKDGMYCARYTDRFGKRQSLYNRKLQDLKVALNNELFKNNMELNLVDNKITLNEWYVKWLTIHKFDAIRNTSKAIYDNVYTKYIAPPLGKLKLSDITYLRIKSVINDVKRKGLGFETQNKIRILLVDMFGKAMIDDLVSKNPAKGIKLVRKEGIDEDSDVDIKVLSVEEQALFFECCKGTFYDNLFTVAVTTGLRMGELCSLTWDDIDWEKMEIKVTKTLVYAKLDNDTGKTFHLHPPKTKTSNRRVPINKKCAIALKKQIIQKQVISSRSPKKPISGFEDLLFTTKYNTPINAQIFSDAIKAIVNEINLVRDELEQMETFSSHCFRHTFATRSIESDVKPRVLQEYLGHATLDMTMNLYVSILDDYKASEMKKLESLMDTTMDVDDALIEKRYNNVIDKQKNQNQIVKLKESKLA